MFRSNTTLNSFPDFLLVQEENKPYFRWRLCTHLMSPTNKVHVMFVEELCDHIGTKSEGDATVVLAPAQHVFVWVGPQQVAQEALVRDVSGAHDPSDLLHGLEVW